MGNIFPNGNFESFINLRKLRKDFFISYIKIDSGIIIIQID